MRIWSLHPSLLDAKGIVALWRETLLAQHVLAGKTKGYRNHPQLHRFKAHPEPLRAIGFYLLHVAEEAERRGYRFSREKIMEPAGEVAPLPVTSGQMAYELMHLKAKLEARSPADVKRLPKGAPAPHPLFLVEEGAVEAWEKR